MLDESGRLRSFAWSELFPFVRLFQAFPHALAFWPALFALAGVLLSFLVGSAIDVVWRAAGAGVIVTTEVAPFGAPRSEIDAFCMLGSRDFANWRSVSQPSTTTVGPFAAIAQHTERAAAASLQAVASGRVFNRVGGPSVFDGIASFAYGLLWWVTQRPVHAALSFTVLVAIYGFFGAMICRWVALRAANGENLGPREAASFTCERYGSLIAVWLVPVTGLLLGMALITIGGLLVGLLAKIPYLAVLTNGVSGVFFPIVLLGSFAITGIIVLLAFGGQLMWPAIAVEGSDAFDAWQRIPGYLFPRAWKVAGYWLLTIVAGGVWWLTIRAFAILMLKIAHVALGAGVSGFGGWASANHADVTKFEAIWHMPSWSELRFLPGPDGTPFWGQFGSVELSTSEWVYSSLIGFWVYLVVALVIAYGVSYWFAASVHMYFLLRHDVDGVDFSEIYDDRTAQNSPAGVVSTPNAAAPAAGIVDSGAAPN